MFRHEFCVSAKKNIRTSAGHVGRDGNGTFASGLGDDLGFALMLFCAAFGAGGGGELAVDLTLSDVNFCKVLLFVRATITSGFRYGVNRYLASFSVNTVICASVAAAIVMWS